ncbi:MAG: hypothetical protein AUJ18_02350 [Candidatus Hydrogenedentes bacterium CG1_02_42_14]|nr:MAG: hypothetical protein AUJ18_02350 [Candidatus Hydrogenedentes bacterium CG1_02_42_14]
MPMGRLRRPIGWKNLAFDQIVSELQITYKSICNFIKFMANYIFTHNVECKKLMEVDRCRMQLQH